MQEYVEKIALNSVENFVFKKATKNKTCGFSQLFTTFQFESLNNDSNIVTEIGHS